MKTVAFDAFRSQGRGGRGVAGAKLRDEDYIAHIVTTTAHAYLLFFSNLGRVYRLKAHEIPMKERTARGTAMVNLLPLQPDEHIQAIIDTRDYESNQYLFFATKQGQVKKTKFTAYDSSLRAGLIAINLRDGDELVKVIPCNDGDDIFMVSQSGMTVRFAEGDVRPMGRSAAGVRGMKLKAGADDEVVSCDVARDEATILLVTDAGYGKRTKLEHFTRKNRGIQGVKGIKLTARRGRVVAAFMVNLDDEIFVIASGGTVIRMPVREISSQGRDATGVRVMNLDEGQTVAAVAPVLQPDDDAAGLTRHFPADTTEQEVPRWSATTGARPRPSWRRSWCSRRSSRSPSAGPAARRSTGPGPAPPPMRPRWPARPRAGRRPQPWPPRTAAALVGYDGSAPTWWSTVRVGAGDGAGPGPRETGTDPPVPDRRAPRGGPVHSWTMPPEPSTQMALGGHGRRARGGAMRSPPTRRPGPHRS